ncbi:MAG: plastocyanin/azurin family copper-binding protein [Bacteroidota bacterium]|nr:plastocyanin/azurin family copper-binding protein [Bacteroidota bacterium]
MHRLLKILLIILFMVIFYCSNSYSTTRNITAQSNFFSPSTISAFVGDTIRWIWINGSHTTTCDGSPLTSRPAGAAPWDAPLSSTIPSYRYIVTVAGTYNYICLPHADIGMVGVINVSAAPITLDLTTIIEGFWNGVIMVSDTVRVYLRSAVSPFSFVDSAKVKLNNLGNGILTFTNAGSGSYYIVVTHRNSIETWSKLPQSFTAGGTLSYNFTTSADKAYGNNLILKEGKYTIYSGDVNQDGTVDLSDLSLIDNDAFNFVAGYIKTDLNGDNFIDLNDLSIADNNASNFVSKITPVQLTDSF